MGQASHIGPAGTRLAEVVRRGADDPVTRPMPAITTIDNGVHFHRQDGVCVVALDGALDTSFAESAADHLVQLGRNVEGLLVDLDQVTLLEPEALAQVVDVLEKTDLPVALSSTRMSARLLAERWLADRNIALFTSVADALQARAFEADGYGSGWG